MLDADYLRRQAEHCLSLSRATFDLVIAKRLRAMADELQRKASELDGMRPRFALRMASSAPRQMATETGTRSDK